MGSAQDRKIKGGVEIERGTVDVAAPLASARHPSLRRGFGPSILDLPAPRHSRTVKWIKPKRNPSYRSTNLAFCALHPPSHFMSLLKSSQVFSVLQ
jgi:hypothetical protein